MSKFLMASAKARENVFIYGVREPVRWINMIALLLNAALMTGFLGAGFVEGVLALGTFFGLLPDSRFGDAERATALGLEAVELVLLAPLGYVFVSALATFVRSLVEEKGEKWSADLRLVTGVKSLTTSLLISIVAVDFVGKILRHQPMHVQDDLIEAMIFVLLVGFLLALERSMHGRGEDKTPPPN